MRISDWSSDVCSSDLLYDAFSGNAALRPERSKSYDVGIDQSLADGRALISLTAFLRNTTDQINYDNSAFTYGNIDRTRAKGIEATLGSEEHTSELQSLMRISYAVFCLKNKKNHNHINL